MRDRLTAVRLPTLVWAQAAIEDLRAQGMDAALLGGQDAEGCQTVLVSGPADRISALRSASEPASRLCWATFDNQLIPS